MSKSPKRRRNSMRLPDYDYSQSGGYFVTICTQDKHHLFGKVDDGEVILSDMGRVVQECWDAIPEHFEWVELDLYVIMPNHIHGIILIYDNPSNMAESVGERHVSPLQKQSKPSGFKPNSLSAMVGAFKASVTREVRKQQLIKNDTPIWQRGFYDHIIRNVDDAHRIAQYIHDNPLKWESDDYY